MNILAVDDEINALEGLEAALRTALPDASIYTNLSLKSHQ